MNVMPLPLLEALRTRSVVADGAMGTELYARALGFETCFEALNVRCPDLITSIHRAYVDAGAEVIETNTFGANAPRLHAHGLEHCVRSFNHAAVKLARAARPTYVVGALGPTGSSRDVIRATRAFLAEQALALSEAGVDALLVETMCTLDEAEAALEGALDGASGRVPVLVCRSLNAPGTLNDGTTPGAAAKRLAALGAQAVGINCGMGLSGVLEAMEEMSSTHLPLIAMPSAGLPQKRGDRLEYPVTPADFGAWAVSLCSPVLVGGCCGTTPAHITELARRLEGP